MDNDIPVESVYQDDPELYNKKTKAVAPPERNIGIDTANTFLDNIINAGLNSILDLTKIENFSQLAKNRDTIYQLLDTMSEDPTISAALEIYAEDSTETNEEGRIIWCESDDSNVAQFVTYLLDTMNVDKNIYKWAYSLCKYGDLYLRLFRESEIKDDPILTSRKKDAKKLDENLDKEKLDEELKLAVYSKSDHFTHYIEMVSNPAEMFELIRHGKSCGYIKADVQPVQQKVDRLATSYFRYQFKEQDVTIYEPTNFVHACLEDNSSRTPEEVDLFLDDQTQDSAKITYTVRRGEPIFYNAFKIWRCLMLLENSLLLNRITKSSILRVIGVEVGDMDKTQVGPHLMNIKQLIEQKAAFDVGNSMEEYTNPGPIENNIYVPTHNGIGAISTQQIGGDVDVKSIADLDYFKDRFYTALRIPKQYLGDTEDSTGFNGGTALSIISNRYAKMIKRIQNTLIQCITDAVNLMILDKGNDAYINKFQLHMLSPATEEEATRRDNLSSEIQLVRDVMDLTSDLENAKAKTKILKSLLSHAITNQEVLDILQDEIDSMSDDETSSEDDFSDSSEDSLSGMPSEFDIDADINMPAKNEPDLPEQEVPSEETILPTPNELNPDIDFSDNTMEM